MKDETHLYEADKIRISNEAKVRSAAEKPDFLESEYKKWLESGKGYGVNPTHLWVIQGRLLAMGRELAKLGHRIHRQRVANRNLVKRNRELESFLELIESKLAQGIKEESWGSLSKTFLQDLYAKIRRV